LGARISKWLLSLTRVDPLGFSAIDLGQTSVITAVTVAPANNPGDKPRVLRASKVRGEASETTAIKEVGKRCAMPRHPFIAVLSRGDYRILTLDTPAVLPAEMDQAVRLAIGPLVDFPVDAAGVVWFPMPKALGQSTQLTVVTTEQQVSKGTEDAFRAAALLLDIIDVRETAQRNISALLEQNGECLALLSAEPEGLCLTFTQNGELLLDRFIAQPLAALKDASPEEQSDLVRRISSQIERSAEFVQRGYPTAKVERLLLAPLADDFDLSGLLAAQLSLPVETLDLALVLDLSQAPEIRAPEDQALFFIAVGAALRFRTDKKS